MGKSKGRKKKSISQPKKPKVETVSEKKKSRWSLRKVLEYSGWVIAILTIPTLCTYYIELHKTPSEKVKDLHEVSSELKSKPIVTTNTSSSENPGHLYITRPPILHSENPPSLIGILLPKNLLIPKPPIQIDFGQSILTSMNYDLGNYYTTGISYPLGTSGCRIKGVSISFKIIGNRLFLSTSFRDVETNNLVGTIKFNKWTLYIPNLIGFQQTDSSLEVTDLHGYIIIRVKFNGPTSVLLQGYFAGLDSALVAGNQLKCFNIKTDRTPMYSEIKSIDSLPW